MTLLLEEFRFVASQNPADIGEIRDPRFLMDIILRDENERLPLDLPFPTTTNKKLAATRIVDHWLASGIAERSTCCTHASRLTVANKHLNKSDFDKIITRLKTEHNLDYSNPSLLTPYETAKCLKVCLDARSINRMTKDEITCSPNPDMIISEMMSLPSDLETDVSDLQ